MDLSKFTIYYKLSISDALILIEKNTKGFVLLENKNKSIVGIVTDGDIRRKLIQKIKINDSINLCSNKKFVYGNAGTPREMLLKQLDHKIKFIPILDNKNRLINIIFRDNIPLKREEKVYSRSKSPVRISFGGGGSDTSTFFSNSNGAVINATISLYSHTLLRLRNDEKIVFHSNDLNDSIEFKNYDELVKYKGKFDLIKSVIKTINPSFGFELHIDSDYPMNSGLGGSAVVVSSIIGCFNEFRNDKWNSYDMAEIAFQSERLYMNVAGGWQDQYATVFGGLNFMEFNAEQNLINPIRLNNDTLSQLEENLILCYTGKTHNSDNIHIDQKEKTKSKSVENRIIKNVKLTYEMRNHLLKGRLNNFGKCLHKAWEIKKSLSSKISNNYLDDIYNEALENGAIGGKLLGAGGGGYFLFYTPSINRINLINWIKEKGLLYTPFIFEQNGLKSWKVRENK